MKIKDIAAKYNLDQSNFQWWVENNKGFKKNLLSTAIEDTDVEKAVEMYRDFKKKDDAEKAATQLALDAAKKKEQERQQAIAAVLITSGFNFDGYKITKYSGYISGDDARQIDRDHLFDNRGQPLLTLWYCSAHRR